VIHSCFLKCAYLVTPCTTCFLLSVSVLTCVLEDTIFSCLIIVLHCIKDPLLFIHYLDLFNLVQLYWTIDFLCCVIVLMCVCRIYIKGYLLIYLLTSVVWRCWLSDRKCIRPVKTLSPAILKGSSLGDLRVIPPDLEWSPWEISRLN